MECEHYMSERYHSGGPRQEATGSIFVLARKGCGFLEDVFGRTRRAPLKTSTEGDGAPGKMSIAPNNASRLLSTRCGVRSRFNETRHSKDRAANDPQSSR